MRYWYYVAGVASIYLATIPGLSRWSVAVFAFNAAWCGWWSGFEKGLTR